MKETRALETLPILHMQESCAVTQNLGCHIYRLIQLLESSINQKKKTEMFKFYSLTAIISIFIGTNFLLFQTVFL